MNRYRSMIFLLTLSLVGTSVGFAAGQSSKLARSPETPSYALPGGPGGDGLLVFGLTGDQRLVVFESDDPRRADLVGSISGLAGDVRIVGIDFRPATGELYGLGNAGGIYTIDTMTAAATFRAQVNMALSGTLFDVDFNPTVDRLRIVSDAGQNLRANVDTGVTVMDGTLTYSGPAAMGLTGAAYTNNDADPNTATTLFDIDSNLDQVVIQAPPNAGNLNTTGKLLVDATSDAGFDIYTGSDPASNTAFAALNVGGVAGFYRIDLLSGVAELVDNFRSRFPVTDIAISVGQDSDDEDEDEDGD